MSSLVWELRRIIIFLDSKLGLIRILRVCCRHTNWLFWGLVWRFLARLCIYNCISDDNNILHICKVCKNNFVCLCDQIFVFGMCDFNNFVWNFGNLQSHLFYFHFWFISVILMSKNKQIMAIHWRLTPITKESKLIYYFNKNSKIIL